MKKRLNIVLYAMGLLALILMATGCEEKFEQKMLRAFIIDANGASTEQGIEGGTQFTGSISVTNDDVFSKYIAPEDLSGFNGDLEVKMILVIEQSGIVSAGEVELSGKDSIGEFFWKATGKTSGTFKNKRLNVQIHDASEGSQTFIRFQSQGKMDSDNEIEGTASLDFDAKQLGKFVLKMEGNNNLNDKKDNK